MAKGWSKPLSGFVKVVEADLVDRRKEITAKALQAIITSSPVADGAYRGNHRVTLDGVHVGYDLEKKDTSGSQTLSEGSAVIGQIYTPFGESVIQNEIPYGDALENGNSQQAAHGVYGPAFALVKEKFTR